MADYKALLEDEKAKAIRSIVEIVHELGQEAAVARSCVLEKYSDVDVILLDSIVFEVYAEEDIEVQDEEILSEHVWEKLYHIISSADGGLLAQERADQMAKERARRREEDTEVQSNRDIKIEEQDELACRIDKIVPELKEKSARQILDERM